jgi:hypothetical protein
LAVSRDQGAVQMPTIIVSVDLECSCCRAKIEKVLNRIQGVFALAVPLCSYCLPPLVDYGVELVLLMATDTN